MAAQGIGEQGTTKGVGKTCVYGAQTLDVFTVILVAAGEGFTLTKLPGFADGAAYFARPIKIGSATDNEGGIDVLKGTISSASVT